MPRRGGRLTLQEREIKLPGPEQYPKWLIPAAAACGLPFFAVFAFLGDPIRGLAASLSVSALVCIAATLWSFHELPAFWAVLAFSILAHAFLVCQFSGTNSHFPAVVFAPLFIADLLFWQFVAVLTMRATRS